jgi:hypothetical protein
MQNYGKKSKQKNNCSKNTKKEAKRDVQNNQSDEFVPLFVTTKTNCSENDM